MLVSPLSFRRPVSADFCLSCYSSSVGGAAFEDDVERRAMPTRTCQEGPNVIDPNTTVLLNQLGVDPALVETLLSGAIVLTVATLVTAIPTGMIAKRKGRSTALWLLFALSIPVLPLLIVWLLPKLPVDRSTEQK